MTHHLHFTHVTIVLSTPTDKVHYLFLEYDVKSHRSVTQSAFENSSYIKVDHYSADVYADKTSLILLKSKDNSNLSLVSELEKLKQS